MTTPTPSRRRVPAVRAEANISLVPAIPEPPDPTDASTTTGDEPEPLLTPEDLALRLVIPLKTLAHWRTQRTGPLALKVGVYVRYRHEDVAQWLEELAADARTRWAN